MLSLESLSPWKVSLRCAALPCKLPSLGRRELTCKGNGRCLAKQAWQSLELPPGKQGGSCFYVLQQPTSGKGLDCDERPSSHRFTSSRRRLASVEHPALQFPLQLPLRHPICRSTLRHGQPPPLCTCHPPPHSDASLQELIWSGLLLDGEIRATRRL